MPWLQHLVENYPHFVYPLIFLIVIAEGDFFLLLLGVLIREKYLNFGKVYLFAVLAALVHDFIFWSIGKRLSKFRKEKYLFINLEKITLALEKIKPQIGFFIFFSKFIWNFNRITLVSAGYIRTSFKNIIKYSLAASLTWVMVFLSLGYVFADQTEIFKQKIETAGPIILLTIIILVTIQMWLKKTFQSYLMEIRKNSKFSYFLNQEKQQHHLESKKDLE